VQKVVLRDDDVSAVSPLLTVIAPVQAEAPEPSAASAAKGSLAARLAAVVGGGPKATAVGAALDAAPTHSVHATGIVGINPADAAPPWTQEQQAAESEKIAAGVKSLKGTDALPEDSITAQTVAAQDAEIEAEKAAKKAAKKPKGIVGATAPLPEGDAMLAVLTRIADSLEKIAGK
jgi:hypothetical protein